MACFHMISQPTPVGKHPVAIVARNLRVVHVLGLNMAHNVVLPVRREVALEAVPARVYLAHLGGDGQV